MGAWVAQGVKNAFEYGHVTYQTDGEDLRTESKKKTRHKVKLVTLW